MILGLPAGGRFPPEIKRATEDLLSKGPNTWIQLEKNAPKGEPFQRGLSGGNASSISRGTREAIRLLKGFTDYHHRYISTGDRTSNSIFARPLTIKGRTEHFGVNDDPNIRTDYVKVLPKGKTLDSVEAIGLFPPNKKDERTDVIPWARSYVYFCNQLSKYGVRPSFGSRGAQFLMDVETSLQIRNEGLKKSALENIFLKYHDPEWIGN